MVRDAAGAVRQRSNAVERDGRHVSGLGMAEKIEV